MCASNASTCFQRQVLDHNGHGWGGEHLKANQRALQIQNLGKWELLGAMQANTVYTLIRLEEGETDDNNIDSLLVETFKVCAYVLTLT